MGGGGSIITRFHAWPSTQARASGSYEIAARSARAAWARSIARAIRGSDATSRSRCCPPRSRPTPIASQRFEQEARAAAALNHPNILAVHDIGTEWRCAVHRVGAARRADAAGAAAGRARPGAQGDRVRRPDRAGLGGGAREGDHASRSEAREPVHHADDRVKILDFGLAKLTHDHSTARGRERAPDGATADRARSGARHRRLHGARAGPRPAVDHRADLFAFGAVLYEMLSGQRAFQRDTAPETMTAILNEDPPDLLATERPIPPALARIVHRCLEKSPPARFQTASDLAFALEALSDPSGATQGVGPSRKSKPRERLAWMSALAFVTAIAAVAMVWAFRPGPAAPEVRLDITAPPTTDPASMALSPDGKQIVFAGTSQGRHSVIAAGGSIPHRRGHCQGPTVRRCRSGRPIAGPSASLPTTSSSGSTSTSGSVQELTEARVLRRRLMEPRRRDHLQPECAASDLSGSRRRGVKPVAVTRARASGRRVTVFLSSFPTAATSCTTCAAVPTSVASTWGNSMSLAPGVVLSDADSGARVCLLGAPAVSSVKERSLRTRSIQIGWS